MNIRDYINHLELLAAELGDNVEVATPYAHKRIVCYRTVTEPYIAKAVKDDGFPEYRQSQDPKENTNIVVVD